MSKNCCEDSYTLSTFQKFSSWRTGKTQVRVKDFAHLLLVADSPRELEEEEESAEVTSEPSRPKQPERVFASYESS